MDYSQRQRDTLKNALASEPFTCTLALGTQPHRLEVLCHFHWAFHSKTLCLTPLEFI